MASQSWRRSSSGQRGAQASARGALAMKWSRSVKSQSSVNPAVASSAPVLEGHPQRSQLAREAAARLDDLPDRRIAHSIEHVDAASAGFGQARLAEDAQVMGHQGLREAGLLDELGDRLAIEGHGFKQAQPGRVGQSFEDPSHHFRTGVQHVKSRTSWSGQHRPVINLCQCVYIQYLRRDLVSETLCPSERLRCGRGTALPSSLNGDGSRRGS